MMIRRTIFLTGCAAALFLVSAKCNDDKAVSTKEPEKTETTVQTPAPQDTVPSTPAPSTNVKGTKVKIHTQFGDMIAVLYDETPKHRDNFLKLTDEKFYDGLLFHRCIRGFMIQGGDPNSRNAAPNTMLGSGGPGYTVPAEFNANYIHKKGALAAARQGDQVNPTRSSSGSQFYIVQGRTMTDMQIDQMQQYINQKTPGFKYTEEQRKIYRTIGGTAQLDMDYTVFGEVIQGLNIIDSIAAQPTKPGDRPMTDIKMSIERVK